MPRHLPANTMQYWDPVGQADWLGASKLEPPGAGPQPVSLAYGSILYWLKLPHFTRSVRTCTRLRMAWKDIYVDWCESRDIICMSLWHFHIWCKFIHKEFSAFVTTQSYWKPWECVMIQFWMIMHGCRVICALSQRGQIWVLSCLTAFQACWQTFFCHGSWSTTGSNGSVSFKCSKARQWESMHNTRGLELAYEMECSHH